MITFVFQRGWRCLQFAANNAAVCLSTKFPTSKKPPATIYRKIPIWNLIKRQAPIFKKMNLKTYHLICKYSDYFTTVI